MGSTQLCVGTVVSLESILLKWIANILLFQKAKQAHVLKDGQWLSADAYYGSGPCYCRSPPPSQKIQSKPNSEV